MQAGDATPIACTLPAAVLKERLAWIRWVTAESLLEYKLDGTTLRLTYHHQAEADLRRIVAQEQKCCAFLRFDLSQAGATVQLTIEAPDGLDADARWLFDQFLRAPSQLTPKAGCGCALGRCG